MPRTQPSTDNLHSITTDIQSALTANTDLHNLWNGLTPLARNEWICWIQSAQKPETRAKRLRIMTENLPAGKRRPCCWAGCPHR